MLDHHYGLRELTFSHTNTLFQYLAVSYNMGLRSENQSMSGISLFWQNTSTEIQQEWSRRIELFEATFMAKSSISLEEQTRDNSVTPRRKELIGGAEEPIAQRKAVSFLYFSLAEAARKTSLGRKPDMDINAINLKDLLKQCNDVFHKKSNWLMNRHKFLNRKQRMTRASSKPREPRC